MLKDESEYTYFLVKKLIEEFPEKQYVFDAGALQMMDKDWLKKLKKPAIITPHQEEFRLLFGNKQSEIKNLAESYKTIILLKKIQDVVTDGKEEIIVEGGNAGLTKGGTGDILAGVAAALAVNNLPLVAAASASILLKSSADLLFQKKGYWYNINDLINKLPEVLADYVLFDKN